MPYYERYRLGYPERLIARVIALAGLKPGDAVLDLGCGPGLLAIALRQAGMAVTAADPEPDMLAAAEAAREAAVMVDFRRGGSFDLHDGHGPLPLVTIGRAFHWMDRAATLAMLDRIVAPDGAWRFSTTPIPARRRMIGARPCARSATAMAPITAHGGARAASRISAAMSPCCWISDFSVVESVSVVVRKCAGDRRHHRARLFAVRHLAGETGRTGRAHSKPICATNLRALSPSGNFTEIAEMVALVARRP